MSSLLKKLQELSTRERRLMIMTLTVVIMGLGYMYIVEPIYVGWSTLRTESVERQAQLHKLRVYAKKENKDLIDESFSKVQNSIPIGTDLESLEIGFLEEINTVAQLSEFQVTSLKPLSVEHKGRYEQLQVQIHGSCEGHQFMKFLQQLQDSSHLIHCRDITITAGKSRPPLSVTVTLSKFVMYETSGRL